MFDKIKRKLAAQWLAQSNAVPDLTLNTSDKIYLATAKRSGGKLTYVYILACLKTLNNNYEINPTTQIATFDNAKRADIFYETVKRVMEYQNAAPGVRQIRDALSEDIAAFNQKTR